MSEYDGKIQLGMDVSPDDAIKSFKRLQAQAQKTFNSLSTEKSSKEVERLSASLSKSVSNGEKLQATLEKVSNTKIPTDEYKELTKDIEYAEKSIERLYDKQANAKPKKAADIQSEINAQTELVIQLKQELKELEESGKAFKLDTTSIENAKNALADNNNQIRLNQEALANLRQTQSEAAAEQAAKVREENDALAQQVAKMLDIQLNAGQIDEKYGQVATRLQEVNNALEQMYARQKDLEQAGKGLGYEEYNKNLSVIRSLESEQASLTEKVEEYRRSLDGTGKSASDAGAVTQRAFSGVSSKIASVLKQVAQLSSNFISSAMGLDRYTSAFAKLTNRVENTNFSFKKLFRTLLKYGLGMRSFFVLFRKIRSAITEGLAVIAQFNGGLNSTNAAMTQLTSSLSYLKGALVTAFAPIITVISPALSSFIDQMAEAINAIGMFIARLTGARSYIRAVRKTTDYASSAAGGSSGKSAQEKYEEAVAKAQKKYEEQLAKVREKNAKAQAKAEEKQAKAAKKLAEQQEKANKRLADFDDLNVLNIESLEELEEIEAEVYEEPELELPNLEDFLSGGGGAGSPYDLEEIPLDGLDWDWDYLKDLAEDLGRGIADKLNNIFKDEALAKKIGTAIAELLNIALHFAYGFIDQFDWRQLGRWLGTLVQSGIETFEWGLLGETIAKFLNGVADSVIGFFERYQVGTLGQSIAEMFNRAIDEIDPDLIGEAVRDVLQAPLIELSKVLTETNFSLAAEKLTTFFDEVFGTKGLDNERLGTTIGKTLGRAINAGIDFLLSLDIYTLVLDLGLFISDIFEGAMGEIKWIKIMEALIEGFKDIGSALQTLLNIWVNNLIIGFAERLNEFIGFDLIKQKTIDSLKETNDLLEKGLLKTSEILEGSGLRFVEIMNNIGEGTQYSRDQLIRWQEAGGLTNQQIEEMIQSMKDYAREHQLAFDETALGLEGYTGNWEKFRDTVLGVVDETNEKVKSSETVVNDLSDTADLLAEKSKNAGSVIKDEADTTAEKLDHTAVIGKNHLGILDDALETSDKNVNDFSDSAVTAIDKVDAKTGEVKVNFESMTSALQVELDTLTTAIDTWYQEIMTNYFGYDKWLALLQEGPLLALTDFFTTVFMTEWDTQMQSWWDEHVIIWFANSKWEESGYTPWFTYLSTRWQAFIIWWDRQLNVWWTNHVVPMFKEKKWKDEFLHIYDAAKSVGEDVRDTVTELASETETAVIDACHAMTEAIQEVIKLLNEAASLAASLGSTAGGIVGSVTSGSFGGGSSQGGGGGGGGFMPRLDIMHFEDNLGMSAFKFPELATGAVIPPNNEFLAVLGDQRNGMNIETPLATMVEAFRSVMDEYMGGSHQSATMEVDGETFARLMMPHIMDEMHRLGYNTEIIEGM